MKEKGTTTATECLRTRFQVKIKISSGLHRSLSRNKLPPAMRTADALVHKALTAAVWQAIWYWLEDCGCVHEVRSCKSLPVKSVKLRESKHAGRLSPDDTWCLTGECLVFKSKAITVVWYTFWNPIIETKAFPDASLLNDLIAIR